MPLLRKKAGRNGTVKCMAFRTRKEKVQFLISKLGPGITPTLAELSDKDLRAYFNRFFDTLKNLSDYDETDDSIVICKRCGQPVNTEFHMYCDCGCDRALLVETETNE